MPVREPWNPWRELRRREHLSLYIRRLPDGLSGLWSGDTITLDDRLGRRRRNATLAHELIHEERGIGHPAATRRTMQHEEEQVRRETARRLVPPGALAELVARRIEVEPITVAIVAEEFDVPREVAALSVRMLQEEMLDHELQRSARPPHRVEGCTGWDDPEAA